MAMTLPKLSVPRFELTIPSSGKRVTFRPFLVREEKVLLMALEAGDEASMTNAIIDIIDACVEDDVKASEMPSFDLEFIFLQIRSKSVGEKVDIPYTHQFKKDGTECGHEQAVTIDISKIEVQRNEDHTKNIQITDDIVITLKYPTIDTVNNITDDGSLVDGYLKLVVSSIEKVVMGEEAFDMNLYTDQAIQEFVESMSQEQFQRIVRFYETMPVLKYNLTYTCEGCGETVNDTIQGLRSFFH